MATVDEVTTAKSGVCGMGVIATIGGDSSSGIRKVAHELTQAMNDLCGHK